MSDLPVPPNPSEPSSRVKSDRPSQHPSPGTSRRSSRHPSQQSPQPPPVADDIGTPWRTSRLKTLTRRLDLLIVGTVLLVTIFLALLGATIAPQDPAHQDLLLGAGPPSPEHWLGTDDLGRDMLSRLLVGTRSAVIGPLVIALGALILGSAIGLVAGFRGGRVGTALMRSVDLIYAVPALLVAIVVAGVVGGGYWTAVALLVVLFCPFDARVVRGATLQQKGLPYVEAASMLGTSQTRVLLQEIWPNVRPIELATAFLNFAYGVIYMTALAFLGIGVSPGTPDWGRMLSEGLGYIQFNPWGVIAPGLAIIIVAASVTLAGDRLEEWFSDSGESR